MHGETLKKHFDTLNEEVKNNESAVINKENLSANELVNLWKRQVNLQQTMMWLKAIQLEKFPALVKPVNNGGLIVAQ